MKLKNQITKTFSDFISFQSDKEVVKINLDSTSLCKLDINNNNNNNIND